MSVRRPIGPVARRALVFAAVLTGATLAAACWHHPRLALFTGTLAAAAALSVLQHLVNLEETR